MQLSDKWASRLGSLPETGMGYQSCTVVLQDGRRFEQVVIVGCRLMQIKNVVIIPFAEEDIAEIEIATV